MDPLAILDDATQQAPLEDRVRAALSLENDDPRLARPPLVVPAGEFWRGGEGHPNEQPRRRLALAAFAIDRYPVTVSQYRRFVEGGGYRAREYWSEAGWAWAQAHPVPRFWDEPEWAAYVTPNRPLVGATFFEAQAYAHWVGRRLPTEAEWERAARGEDGREYPWGDGWDPSRCHHRGGHRGTLPVGCFPAGVSPVGAFDMAGNVWEWCSDWFDPAYYAAAPARDPKGPARGELRVARGGGWNGMPGQQRCANRNAWPEDARFSNLGFRLAM